MQQTDIAIVYSLTSIYFSGVMVRLMLVLTPIVCVLAAVGVSSLLDEWLPLLKQSALLAADAAPQSIGAVQAARHTSPLAAKRRADFAAWPASRRAALAVVGLLTTLTLFFQIHSTWVTSEVFLFRIRFPSFFFFFLFVAHFAKTQQKKAYSSPSIVLASKNYDGSRNILDDFRESYRWINQNTDPDARIMSWWDYGYDRNSVYICCCVIYTNVDTI
jgi:dolichyl-diphosphooligosaccharide--protein glycosyltransferase